ncbi:glycosyltransferase involved in cell wall biosynthesis [Saccharopolyspora lacisalsi]|uniref:Glycosyltransferase involved in cell wall biosynthesis n=1 Tax=Halosaccharopolyspora lacisalsi TaxID=1000566 RepID=A0A839DST8_9PSEU|nr:glycosyltransferase family 2 protein [Halosaccharopolyspora lacisalsi]MBA8824574.1 glycosyltransferase involved in cell wall biosynthesis [Halosaccharopolyspora lacisalsi]
MAEHVDVILPCLDEAAALPPVLRSITESLEATALVVDNGSTDGSPEVAAEHGARVVHEPVPGYGAAVHTGLLHATAEIVCVVDADGSVDPGELTRLIAPVREDTADLVVGRRVPTERAAFPWHARAGNAVLAAMLRRRGVPVRDLAPVRVVRRDQLLKLDVRDRAFGYPLELLLRAGQAGWRLRELPVDYQPRASGTRSKVSGSVRGTARAVRDMIGVLR